MVLRTLFTVLALACVFQAWPPFVGVHPTGLQFDGLYFSADGWVGGATMLPTDAGSVSNVRREASGHNFRDGRTQLTPPAI